MKGFQEINMNDLEDKCICITDPFCCPSETNQFISVQSLSHVQLCDPMNCSTPDFPVHYQLLELAQTHVHWVDESIQPPCPSPPAFNLSQHQGLFQWVSSLHQVAKVLEFQHQSFRCIFRVDFFRILWFDLLAVQRTLKSLLQNNSSKASVLQYSAFFIL